MEKISGSHLKRRLSLLFTALIFLGVAPSVAELEAYANSMPGTYGQPKVRFLYAQPSPELSKA